MVFRIKCLDSKLKDMQFEKTNSNEKDVLMDSILKLFKQLEDLNEDSFLKDQFNNFKSIYLTKNSIDITSPSSNIDLYNLKNNFINSKYRNNESQNVLKIGSMLLFNIEKIKIIDKEELLIENLKQINRNKYCYIQKIMIKILDIYQTFEKQNINKTLFLNIKEIKDDINKITEQIPKIEDLIRKIQQNRLDYFNSKTNNNDYDIHKIQNDINNHFQKYNYCLDILKMEKNKIRNNINVYKLNFKISKNQNIIEVLEKYLNQQLKTYVNNSPNNDFNNRRLIRNFQRNVQRDINQKNSNRIPLEENHNESIENLRIKNLKKDINILLYGNTPINYCPTHKTKTDFQNFLSQNPYYSIQKNLEESIKTIELILNQNQQNFRNKENVKNEYAEYYNLMYSTINYDKDLL